MAGLFSLRKILQGVVFSLLAASGVQAAESESAGAQKPVESNLPKYECGYHNGLYATIAGYNSIKDFKLPELQPMRLQVPDFNCCVPCRAIIQPGQAPLVVVLLGAEGSVMDPLWKRWISWMGEAGWHVLAFNSTLHKDFAGICGRGVNGNIEGEAECVRDIISAALKTPCLDGRVSQLGVVGLSYGGIEALFLGKMAAEGKLPYKIDAIQAYSPPVDMMKSAELIDRWWREDRWQYTLAEIYFKVSKHKPVQPGCCIPLSDSMMRAGLSAAFRLDLVEIVDRNDAHFDLNLLPPGDTFEKRVVREQYAATWGFSRFMREATYPFWKEKLNLNSFEDLNAGAKLCVLLPKAGPISEVIITDDDPLNVPEDFEALKQYASKSRLTVLCGGGHVGYTNEPWTRAKLMELFKK